MQKSYTISKDSKEIGSFTVDEILQSLAAGTIAVTDYIYIEEQKDWVSLLEFQPVIEFLKSKKPKSAPKVEVEQEKPLTMVKADSNISDDEWYLLRDEKKTGPYHYLDLIKMLQEKQAYEFDYVWNGNMAKWARMAELREFSPERLQVIMKQHKDLFVKRNHRRASYSNEIFVSDSAEIFNGKYLQISEGGAKIRVSHSMFSPGDKIVVHHKESSDLPAFNAECEIVNKAYSPIIRNKHQEVEYIVRFLQLNDMAKKSIVEYTKKLS